MGQFIHLSTIPNFTKNNQIVGFMCFLIRCLFKKQHCNFTTSLFFLLANSHDSSFKQRQIFFNNDYFVSIDKGRTNRKGKAQQWKKIGYNRWPEWLRDHDFRWNFNNKLISVYFVLLKRLLYICCKQWNNSWLPPVDQKNHLHSPL